MVLSSIVSPLSSQSLAGVEAAASGTAALVVVLSETGAGGVGGGGIACGGGGRALGLAQSSHIQCGTLGGCGCRWQQIPVHRYSMLSVAM